MEFAERELTEPVDLTTATGRLNVDAVGWARRPLVATDKIGHGRYGWGRNKRWEYWNVMTPGHIVAITVSSLDYATLTTLTVIDRATKESIDDTRIAPLGEGVRLPGSLGIGPVRATHAGLAIAIDDTLLGTRLRAKSERVRLDLRVMRPAGHECLAVVVPWSDRLFQYTVKDVARPAAGRLRVDGRTELVGEGSWGVLDHGRGRWPYSMVWNWGAGSGVVDGHVVGVQIGGKWTDGTGSTENCLFVDGRAHKISEELAWDYDLDDPYGPWRIRGDRVDLTLTPNLDRISSMDLGIVATSGWQMFGEFSGWMADDVGNRVDVTGAEGWVEHVANRW